MIKSANVFLNFNGNCKQALDFYKNVFGAQIVECTTYKEAEMTENDNEKDFIMNSNIMIGGILISCADNLEQNSHSGNQIALWLETDSEESFHTIYSKFESQNLTILTEKEETFWNSIYAKVQDDFGVIWEINYQK